mmetsp:Transcript_93668/g.195343  ORF Transcript_93668/g.195343 Transcript_93668/m.195343 type:complete len:101 (-) Transcript_93668:262-564(-)
MLVLAATTTVLSVIGRTPPLLLSLLSLWAWTGAGSWLPSTGLKKDCGSRAAAGSLAGVFADEDEGEGDDDDDDPCEDEEGDRGAAAAAAGAAGAADDNAT